VDFATDPDSEDPITPEARRRVDWTNVLDGTLISAKRLRGHER
jgi:hypothetical protein